LLLEPPFDVGAGAGVSSDLSSFEVGADVGADDGADVGADVGADDGADGGATGGIEPPQNFGSLSSGVGFLFDVSSHAAHLSAVALEPLQIIELVFASGPQFPRGPHLQIAHLRQIPSVLSPSPNPQAPGDKMVPK